MSHTQLTWPQIAETQVAKALSRPLVGSPPPFPFGAVSEILSAILPITDCALSVKESEFEGENSVIVRFDIPPLKSHGFIAIDSVDADKLIAAAFAQDQENSILRGELKKGFFLFVGMHVAEHLSHTWAGDDLPLRVSIVDHLDELPSITRTVALSFKIHDAAHTCHLNLICSHEMLKKMKSHFKKPSFPLFTETEEEELHIFPSITIGSTSLSPMEWENLDLGDFLLLDRCSYDPEGGKGTFSLDLAGKPIFYGRYTKERSMKIIDFATHTEDASAADLTEAPLIIRVETGRIDMTIKEFKALVPDSLLNVSAFPENELSLIAEGRAIGKGRLIKLGEALGIQITEKI